MVLLTPEFMQAVQAKNLLRARIMLKDSMLVDPTFVQFNKMMDYAKRHTPNIIMPPDNEILESDTSKWTRELLDVEMVQLVNNFSERRIAHIQGIISLVMHDEIEAFQRRNASVNQRNFNRDNDQQRRTNQGNSNHGMDWNSVPKWEYSRPGGSKTIIRGKMIEHELHSEVKNIIGIMRTVKEEGLNMDKINKLEKETKKILESIERYKGK